MSRLLVAVVALTSAIPAYAAEHRYHHRPHTTVLPPVTVKSVFPDTCPANYNENTFANSACYTDDDPTFESNYKRAQCLNQNLSGDHISRLQDTFKLAPPYVKNKLCNLSGHQPNGNDCTIGSAQCFQLFVRRSGEFKNSWGVWEAPDKVPHGMNPGVFIAIAEAALDSVSSLADEENDALRGLGLLPSGTPPTALPSYNSADPADPTFRTLAVLAHELGHVLIGDGNVDGVEDDHPRRTDNPGKVGDPKDFCFAAEFLRNSWDANAFKGHQVRWVTFRYNNEVHHKHRRDPSGNFKWTQVRQWIGSGRYDQAADKLKTLFGRKEFISFWAALRPEEDVVETFKYKVLADATTPLRSLGLVFPSSSPQNVVDLLAEPAISKKINCLMQLDFFEQ